MITIHIIANTENRLEQFKPIFSWMKLNNLCKISNGYVIVPTNLLLNPRDEVEIAFRLIQEYSRHKGYSYNCYQYGEV